MWRTFVDAMLGNPIEHVTHGLARGKSVPKKIFGFALRIIG